jgi:hypothetical protein
MTNLTDDQQSQLDAVMAELETFPTPELIVESGRLRTSLPLDDAGKRLMRQAYAGGIAAQKLLAYIETLREVDERRGQIGRQVHQKLRDAKVWRAMRSLDAALPEVEASYLAGQQEVMFHFFAVCVGRIERFLEIAAKAAGHKIPQEDRELLAGFRELRNYYEHMEDELPGRKSYNAAEAETERDGTFRMKIGFTLDGEERIILNGVVVDVTPRGLGIVETVLQRHWNGLKVDALALVRKYFENNPSAIPSPKDVRYEPIVSVGGV